MHSPSRVITSAHRCNHDVPTMCGERHILSCEGWGGVGLPCWPGHAGEHCTDEGAAEYACNAVQSVSAKKQGCYQEGVSSAMPNTDRAISCQANTSYKSACQACMGVQGFVTVLWNSGNQTSVARPVICTSCCRQLHWSATRSITREQSSSVKGRNQVKCTSNCLPLCPVHIVHQQCLLDCYGKRTV